MGIFSSLGSFGANLGILGGAAGQGGRKYLRQIRDLWNKLETPNFDYRDLTAPELQVLAEQFPEVYTAVVPKEAQTVSDSPEARAAQVRAQGRAESMATGQNLDENLARQQAAESVQAAQRRADLSILSDLAQRGRLGAGDEIQARMMSGQRAAGLSRDLGLDMARDASGRRLAANAQAGGMAGDIRSGDTSLSARNADIANRFNEMAANIQNQAGQFNAQQRQQAGAWNAQNTQNVGNANAAMGYQVSSDNLNRQNTLRDQDYANQLQKLTGQTGALSGLSDAKYREQAAKAQTIQSVGTSGGQALDGILAAIFGGMGGGATVPTGAAGAAVGGAAPYYYGR